MFSVYKKANHLMNQAKYCFFVLFSLTLITSDAQGYEVWKPSTKPNNFMERFYDFMGFGTIKKENENHNINSWVLDSSESSETLDSLDEGFENFNKDQIKNKIQDQTN